MLIVRGVRIYLAKQRVRKDLDHGMQIIAQQAAKRARQEFQVDLDFTPASIEKVEGILARIHETHLKTPMSEKDLSLLALRWGAYIGEVLKRVRPGKWQRDSEGAGPNTLPVVFEPGTEAFPNSWVYKRIADGPEDNVLFKFQVFSDPQLRQHLGQPQKPIS
jgi:hypothetical protein